jgi:hypothetical protein
MAVATPRNQDYILGTHDEPNGGLDLPRWLAELGFDSKSRRVILDVVEPSNYLWQWSKAFVEVGFSVWGNLAS